MCLLIEFICLVKHTMVCHLHSFAFMYMSVFLGVGEEITFLMIMFVYEWNDGKIICTLVSPYCLFSLIGFALSNQINVHAIVTEFDDEFESLSLHHHKKQYHRGSKYICYMLVYNISKTNTHIETIIATFTSNQSKNHSNRAGLMC